MAIYCPECGQKVNFDYKCCPYCAEKLIGKDTPKEGSRCAICDKSLTYLKKRYCNTSVGKRIILCQRCLDNFSEDLKHFPDVNSWMEEKKQLDNEIQKVITSINKIEKIHDKHRGKKLNELRSNFMENTSNIKIKRLFKNNYWQFIGCISELIGANYSHRYSISRKAIRFNIENWIQNVPDISKYNFSKKDLSELAEFAIMNHKVFCDMEPLSIAFSRYIDRYDNLLLKYH